MGGGAQPPIRKWGVGEGAPAPSPEHCKCIVSGLLGCVFAPKPLAPLPAAQELDRDRLRCFVEWMGRAPKADITPRTLSEILLFRSVGRVLSVGKLTAGKQAGVDCAPIAPSSSENFSGKY